jgi:hypothetical protein
MEEALLLVTAIPAHELSESRFSHSSIEAN